MQALPQLLRLQSLESIIDPLLWILVPETALLNAIALIEAGSKNVFVFSSLQVAEWLTKHDRIMLVASETRLKTAKIFEVMIPW
ncbi:hypothetical protein [Nostoc sp.]|uniref:hypothetical protein n=1 Tax=Nostoc sp. TaxID=1180 RepID=UPI002FFD3B4C